MLERVRRSTRELHHRGQGDTEQGVKVFMIQMLELVSGALRGL